MLIIFLYTSIFPRSLFFLGPVFVEFPIDVLYPYHLVKREAGIKVFISLFYFHMRYLM